MTRKMRMILSILMIAVMTVSVSACATDANKPTASPSKEGAASNQDSVSPANKPEESKQAAPESDEQPKTDSGKKELNIFTWAGYIPDEVVKDFEDETGIKVNYSNFDTNDEMLSKIEAQKNQYDIILCSDYIIEIMAQKNLLEEINWPKIPNAKNIDPSFQSKYYDPDNKFTIPYAPSSAILVYDSAKVGFDVKSYADLWKPEFNNKLVMLDGDRDLIGVALLKLGYGVNETDPVRLNEAKEELLRLKENIVAFDANTPHNSIINGDAVAGYMFGSQASAALAEVPTLKFAYPEEGLSVYMDNIVMPKGAPNPESAYIFMNYILDGEVSAKASALINYINCNTAAKEFLPQEYLDNRTVNIPSEIMQSAQQYMNVGDAALIYNQIWTEFKSQ